MYIQKGLILCLLVTIIFEFQSVPQSPGRTPSSIFISIKEFFQGNGRIESISKDLGLDLKDHVLAKEVVIAILDTGIDLNNKWLMERVYKIKNMPQIYDLSGITTNGSDTHGHGTMMASLILSVNPNARIIPIKCMFQGDGSEDAYVQALKLARLIPGVHIINISGGGQKYSSEEDTEISEAKDRGIVVVAAAGNDALDLNNSEYYPASLMGNDNMITVANLEDGKSLAQSSNYGSSVIDLGIIGSRIKVYDNEGNIVQGTGTSHATAIVSGLVSLIKGIRPDLSIIDLKDILIKTASRNPKLKYGNINASKAVNLSRNYQSHSTNLKTEVDSLNSDLLVKSIHD